MTHWNRVSTNYNNLTTSGELADQWVTVVGQILDSVISDDDMPNLSLCLLRDAIGGDDVDAVSRYLTLEMDDKWIDDISIVVQRFGPRNT